MACWVLWHMAAATFFAIRSGQQARAASEARKQAQVQSEIAIDSLHTVARGVDAVLRDAPVDSARELRKELLRTVLGKLDDVAKKDINLFTRQYFINYNITGGNGL